MTDFYSNGLNTSFSQSKVAVPEPPYQPSWPEFFDGASFNRTVPGHPGFLPTGPTGGVCKNASAVAARDFLCDVLDIVQVAEKWRMCAVGNYYWPTTERSIANVGAAFPEAVIRSLFGFQPGFYQPSVGHGEVARAKAVESQLLSPHLGRPFTGTLTGLWTSYGLADLTAGSEGVSVSVRD